MNGQPRLGAFLNGLPDFENLFGLLRRLQERGRTDLRIWATSALLRAEPRAAKLLRDAGLPVRVRPNQLMKARPWYLRALADMDALISLGDPAIDTTSFRHRLRAAQDAGLPIAFLQHGVIQGNTTYSMSGHPLDYASRLILLFEETAADPPVFTPQTAARTEVCGFYKQAVFPPKPPPDRFRRTLESYRKGVLFCHSFRWTTRYDGSDIDGFYDLVEHFCQRHPDLAIIIRAHRGKSRASYSDHDRRLQRTVPNAFFCNQYSGPFRGMTMTDALHLSDALVSTASTALLDGIYMGKPTSVYLNDAPVFEGLQQITDARTLADFVEAPSLQGQDRLRNHFGDPAKNIEALCDRLEQFGTASMQEPRRRGLATSRSA